MEHGAFVATGVNIIGRDAVDIEGPIHFIFRWRSVKDDILAGITGAAGAEERQAQNSAQQEWCNRKAEPTGVGSGECGGKKLHWFNNLTFSGWGDRNDRSADSNQTL